MEVVVVVALSLLIAQSVSSGSAGSDSGILVQRAVTHGHGIKNHLFMWGDPPSISEESYGGSLPFTMVDSELATLMPKKPGQTFMVEGRKLFAIEAVPGKYVVAVPRSAIKIDMKQYRNL
jgi:hypothetical protein